jgi:riboflavin biosynthesis pyrimidine reductase
MKALGNLVMLAIIVAGAWYLWNWQFGGGGDSEAMSYAERSCVDELRSRFDTTTVRANSVRENANGFTVRATMTLARGNTARATCLTSHNGRVVDVLVDER